MELRDSIGGDFAVRLREVFPLAPRDAPDSGDTDRDGASVDAGRGEGPSLAIWLSSGGTGTKLHVVIFEYEYICI